MQQISNIPRESYHSVEAQMPLNEAAVDDLQLGESLIPHIRILHDLVEDASLKKEWAFWIKFSEEVYKKVETYSDSGSRLELLVIGGLAGNVRKLKM